MVTVNKTNATSPNEFYSKVKGKYLDDCDLDSLSSELKGLVNKSRGARDAKRKAGFTDIDKNIETFKSDIIDIDETVNGSDFEDVDDFEESEYSDSIIESENEDDIIIDETDDVDDIDEMDGIGVDPVPEPKKKTSISDARNNEDAMVKVGMITCIIIFLVIQACFVIPWGIDGFPQERTFGVFIPTIVIVVLYGIITIVDLIRFIRYTIKTNKSKGGKDK